jgi:hypothetical protein
MNWYSFATWIRTNQNPKEVGGAPRRQPLLGFIAAHRTVIEPREIFESGASRYFQKSLGLVNANQDI